MIDLPKTIRILHRTYTVEAFRPNDAAATSADGICEHTIGRIRIDTSLHDELILETLFHEIAHAINKVAGITDSTSEEKSVTRSTPLWLAVFHDNPHLLTLLCLYSDNAFASNARNVES